MASSARTVVLAAAGAAAVTLSGCVSTQERAAWLHLENRRLLAGQGRIVVTAPSSAVRVGAVSISGDLGEVAVSARLVNQTAVPLIDVPVTVGTLIPSRRLLNGGTNLPFFATHVPAIPPRGTVTWVFTAPRPRARLARPFVLAGAADPGVRLDGNLPALSAGLAWRRGTRLEVRVGNASSIPQPDLQVYVTAGRAAGRAEVGLLGGGSAATVSVRLIGPVTAPPQIEVIPTMYQLSS